MRVNELVQKASGLKHFFKNTENSEFLEAKNKVGQNNQMTIELPYIKVSEDIEKLKTDYR